MSEPVSDDFIMRMVVYTPAISCDRESAKKAIAGLSDAQHRELALIHMKWAECLPGKEALDIAQIMMDYLEENGFERDAWYGMCHKGYYG